MIVEAKSHVGVADATVGETFLKSLTLLEQVHRRLHDVVKDDLERSGERSLTGVQALLLYQNRCPGETKIFTILSLVIVNRIGIGYQH